MADGDKPTHEDRPFWWLSPDDQHALWVSFIGSVVSALVLALVVGGAIVLAREYKPLPWWQLLIPTLVWPVLALMSLRAYRITKRRGKPAGVWFLAGALAFGLLAVFEVLIWYGIASGIKGTK